MQNILHKVTGTEHSDRIAPSRMFHCEFSNKTRIVCRLWFINIPKEQGAVRLQTLVLPSWTPKTLITHLRVLYALVLSVYDLTHHNV